MASTSESILLSKPANKLGGKGQDPIRGNLTISDVKVLWKPENPGACGEEAILLNDVQRQQQVKGKPFLRIVATSGKALGLGFNSEDDRNEVLELLKQRKGAGEAAGGLGSAERRALLKGNRDLEALYNQLVVTGILTEGEFWSKHGGTNGGQLGPDGGSATAKMGQRLGLSSVMHEVEKLHDGKTERVNIHLTSQDIQRIFRDKPEVNRAFIAYVPHSMTEEAFWQKYFKLEYKQAARRKNIGGVGEEDKDDIFAPFREHVDEEETAMARSRLHNVDPTLDLFSEYVGARWAGGSRSLGADTSRSDEAVAPATAKLKSLANELNRHSFHVLDGPIGDAADDGNMSTVAMAASLEEARKKHASMERDALNDEERAEQIALYKMRASSDLADLRGKQPERTIPLSIVDKVAFLRINKKSSEDNDGVAAKGPAEGGVGDGQKGDVVMKDVSSFAVDPTSLVPVPYYLSEPEKALEEFCAMDSERFVKEFGTAGLSAASVSPEEAMGGVMVEFFRLEALKTDELLRHFWSNKLSPSGGDTEKMLRLRKHLSVQRESYVCFCAPSLTRRDRRLQIIV